MFKLVVFIPKTHSEEVKTAMFKAGAGHIGAYDCCSFECVGTGQFRPLSGSDPFIGNKDIIEKVEEVKVEMICEEKVVRDVLSAMKKAHPYEEVAFDVIELKNHLFV